MAIAPTKHGLPDDAFRPIMHTLPAMEVEVEGWRVWKLWQHGNLVRLASVTAGTIWQPRKLLEARCPHGFAGHVPHETCHGCGFYTAKTREQLTGLGYGSYGENEVRVYGRVGLAGKVIEGSQGWRSQYAWPVEVWVPTHAPKFVALIAQQYSIPAHLGNLVYTRKVA